jgi:hypothetical protein
MNVFVRQLSTLLGLLSATVPLSAQTSAAGFEFQSVNAELTVGPRHVIKARYVGGGPTDVSLIMESLRCELESEQPVADSDPRRQRILEYSRQRAEKTKGDRTFGGNIIDVKQVKSGTWFVWRVAEVPRAVTSCKLKVVSCPIPLPSPASCSPAEALTLTSVAAPAKTSADREIRVDSTVYRMHDIHEEKDIYIQVHEVANVGRQPILLYPLRAKESVTGCELTPVKLHDGLDDDSITPQLRPGARTYLTFAFRITGTPAATCPITSSFGLAAADTDARGIADNIVTTSCTLEPVGTELTYVDVPNEIEYE